MNIVQKVEDLLDDHADDFTISKAFKEALAEYNASLSEIFTSTSGKDFLVKHTQNMDQLLTLIYKTVLRKFFGNYLPLRNAIPISIIALGSYGREQLALYSDIDLMIVYEEVPGYKIHEIIQAFLHIAWDAKLDLGHRVHEVHDLLKASREDITIKTALLESRFITGSTFAWNATQNQIDIIRKDDPEAFIKAKLIEAAQRHIKYPQSMQPNIKENVGGLRDAHILSWFAFVVYGRDKLKDLTGILFSEDEYKEYRIALEFLYRVRSALHLVQGKKQDTIVLELIPGVSKLLGFADDKSFVSKTFLAMHTLALFSEITICKMSRSFFKSEQKHLRHMRLDRGFYLIEDRLFSTLNHKPMKALNLLSFLNSLPDQKMSFDPSILKVLTETVFSVPQNKKESLAFYQLFSRQNTAPFLRLFYQAQILSKLFAPMQKVHFLAQFDGYHKYPVTIHSIMCVKELEQISEPFILSLYESFSAEEKKFLKLVVFMHDAGKGRQQEHSEVGAKLFNAYAQKIGLSAELTELGIVLIKHHVLMSNIAFKEDIYNESVLFSFMSIIGSQKTLDMLYVLTYADISGVGPDMFTPFSSRLLHQLYKNASEVIEQKDRLSEASKRLKKERSLQKSADFLALPKLRQKKILSIVSNLFFIKHSTQEIIELIDKADDVSDYRYYISNEGHLRLEIYRKTPLNIAYLLSKLTFLPIVSMDIFKLYDDLKYFRIDFSEAVDEADLLFIEEIIHNSFDMNKKVKLPEVTILESDISLDCEHSNTYANMQIHALDQKGLLGFIMTVFEQLHVDISTAKIHTMKKRVRDQFLIEKTENLCDNASLIINALTKKG